ncbi:hypothetical protein AB0F46_35335 [Streptomyces sp. NPDC026665]|uniref:hypothetical protein n=1 Tax=Streptomyces sp. NPDC026665 TaxID=3154798 RepID=UPI0033FE98B1
MTTTVRPWYEDLTDSVTALRKAAYEYKVAQRSLKSLRDSVQFERRRIEEGRIHALPLPSARGGTGWASQPQSRSPHSDTIQKISTEYSRLLGGVNGAFEHAAMLFASGAAWAITQIQKGDMPARVAFERHPWDAHQLAPWSLEIVGLDRYSGTRPLATAYERLAACLRAGEVGQELAAREDLADHEASEMHAAFAHADGTGAAAYAYGLHAEQALGFALLPIRHGATAVPRPAVPEQPGPVDTE